MEKREDLSLLLILMSVYSHYGFDWCVVGLVAWLAIIAGQALCAAGYE